MLALAVAPAWAAEPASWPGRADAAAAQAPSETRFYLLSFEDAPLGEVAEAVLGSALGAPFVVDPSAEGAVTFQASENLTREQLLERFTTTLAARGVRIERQAGRLLLTSAPAPPPPTPATPSPEPVQATPPVIGTPDAEAPGWRGLYTVLAAAGLALMLLGLWMWRRSRGSEFEAARAPRATMTVLERLGRDAQVPAEAVREAQALEAATGARAEVTLVHRGLVTEAALAADLAEASGCAVWRPELDPPLPPGSLDPGLAARLKRLRLAPVQLEPSLVAATDDPLADAAAFRLAADLNRPVRLLVARLSDLQAALGETEGPPPAEAGTRPALH